MDIYKIKSYFDRIFSEISTMVIGQRDIIKKLLIAFLSDGHILLEGLPGLAKTHILKTISIVLNGSFKRIQFTPDLLPSDIIGTMIYNPRNMSFIPSFGPIFNNFILADEINRAPSKVQSALLQAMAEYEVNLGGVNYKLPQPFYVLATQNPIEHEGTYPLPEAQLDRFMFKLIINYPTIEEELEILELIGEKDLKVPEKIIELETFNTIKNQVKRVFIDEKLKKYITEIVFTTREPESFNLSHLASYIQWGASPRATIFMLKASKATALINGRDYVLPEDIRYIVHDVLRHRIILSYEAIAENITTDSIIEEILENRIIP